MFFGKPTDRIDVSDLQKLISDEVLEKKGLDYKQQFSGNSDGDKKELLYDLSSFANAGGGYLICGIEEKDGIPVKMEGIDSATVDDGKLRIENILREGIEPRIPGVSMHSVALSSTKAVLVIHVPRSWAGPHMVKFKGASKFYSRNSAGKYPLDVSEIRAAFLLSETLADKMKNFRTERLGKILANEIPINMLDNPKIILHVIPFSAFNQFQTSEFIFVKDYADLAPINHHGYSPRINFDGLLVYHREARGNPVSSYTQLYRNGIIEAVESYMLEIDSQGPRPRTFPCEHFEKTIIEAVQRYFRHFGKTQVEPPLLIMLSLFGVKGWRMPTNPYGYGHVEGNIDRDNLILPEILVEDLNADIDVIMKPAFDAIWNAAGHEASGCYNEDGRWKGMR